MAGGDLIDVVDVSLGAGVVAEAGPVFRFRHGLVRQVLYERMSAELRSALHARTARALADAGARPGRVAAQLGAVQHTPGTEVEAWVVDWLAAAAPALTYLAPAVAADLLRDVLAELPATDSRREDLEASLVTVAFLLLRHDEVERVGLRLLTQARDPDRAAEMTWMVGYTLMRTGRPAEASVTVREALGRKHRHRAGPGSARRGPPGSPRSTPCSSLSWGCPTGTRACLMTPSRWRSAPGTRWPSATRCTCSALYSDTQRDILGMLEPGESRAGRTRRRCPDQ